MKASEFAAMTTEQLEKKIAELKEELFNLRFRLATGQLDNVMQITAVKRDIARIQTEMRAREIAAAKAQN